MSLKHHQQNLVLLGLTGKYTAKVGHDTMQELTAYTAAGVCDIMLALCI